MDPKGSRRRPIRHGWPLVDAREHAGGLRATQRRRAIAAPQPAVQRLDIRQHSGEPRELAHIARHWLHGMHCAVWCRLRVQARLSTAVRTAVDDAAQSDNVGSQEVGNEADEQGLVR